jgi:taurine dioxygenase
MTTLASRKLEATFSAVPMDTGVGAEIVGIDLSKDMDDATFAEIRAAFYRHSVIVFRKQRITEEQQIAFSRRFGDQEIHLLTQYLHPHHPEILIVSNVLENGRNIGIYDAGRYWHSDLSYMPKPSLASILYALEVPHDEGGQPLGDTMFASVTAAYDALPENIKQHVAGLKAVNSLNHRFEKLQRDGDTSAKLTDEQRKVSEAVHPVVRTHPVTGRKCIFVNDGQTARILDVTEEESGKLLKILCSQCIRPEFVYRHKWQVGDVLMWDNCAVQHLAVADYKLPRRRRMHRTTIAGTVPF